MAAKHTPKDPTVTGDPDVTGDPNVTGDFPEDTHDDITPDADPVQDPDDDENAKRYERRGWTWRDDKDTVTKEPVRVLVDENGDPVPMTVFKQNVIASDGTQVQVVHGPMPTVDWDAYARENNIG